MACELSHKCLPSDASWFVALHVENAELENYSQIVSDRSCSVKVHFDLKLTGMMFRSTKPIMFWILNMKPLIHDPGPHLESARAAVAVNKSTGQQLLKS